MSSHSLVSKNETSSDNNRSVIQPKLKIGQPDDKYEREADTVANHVMMMPNRKGEELVQMQRVEEEELQMKPIEEEEELQMKPAIQRSPDSGMVASPDISSRISKAQGGGRSLPAETETEMGSKMGADFSRVNVHTDSTAAQLSQDLGAKAFTVGNDIYFNKGQYNPSSNDGKKLMAHELVHTVQQGTDGIVRRQGFSIRGKGYNTDVPDGMRSIDIGGGPERLNEFDMQYLAVRVMQSDATILYVIDLNNQIGIAINSADHDALVDAWRRIGNWLYERGVPDRFITSHLYPKIISAEEFTLLVEYYFWERGRYEGYFENEEVNIDEGTEIHEATFPNIDQRSAAGQFQFYLSLAGGNPMTALQFYNIHRYAQSVGISIAVGGSGGLSLGTGGSLGSGYVFLPDGSVGVFGSASFSGGLQISIGVNTDIIIVYGGIELFAGKVYTGSITIGPVGAKGLFQNYTEIRGLHDFVGVSISFGLGLGLNLFSIGEETTGILGPLD